MFAASIASIIATSNQLLQIRSPLDDSLMAACCSSNAVKNEVDH
jgi:hypothetical protein